MEYQMLRTKNTFGRTIFSAWLLICLWSATPLHAYIDLAPTLAKVISDAKQIALIEVAEFDRANHALVLKPIRTLKGESVPDLIRHDVAAAEGGIVPRQIMGWASPGARGVLFISRSTALVCVGEGWYQMRSAGADAWKLGKDRPDLPLAYYGNVSRLAEGIESMLAGESAVLTVVAFGADNEGASFDLALNRASLPGLARMQRIRAELNMPPMVMAASANPAYFLGPGRVDEEDLPALIEKLKSADALERAESADDLRCLGGKADAAAKPLAELLGDSSWRVRLSAAAALLRIAPQDAHPLEILAQGLDNPDAAVRRTAAKAAGLAGPAAAPLIDKLIGMLKDADESLRVAAIQSIALFGPAAASAVDAVVPLLDDPELAIDAADALGRIGSAARPALKRLAKMLTSDEPAVRWAAVRGMSQIGGEDAHPAVDFLIRTLPEATEVEGYNSMIYLSLLGPVAKDAIPTIKSVRIKNPVLPQATLWAIEPEKNFPWIREGRPGMPGFFGGGPGGGGDIFSFMFESYVHELGERLRPSARALARKIMEGTAGEVPSWGYKILACGTSDVLEILVPHLADEDLAMRERAAVALGQMGPAAASAKDSIEAALNKAPADSEKRLLKWCLREIQRDQAE
jgi:HEAT repeat protein